MILQEELAKVVGPENVYHDETVLRDYSRDMSFVKSIKPSCVIKPRTSSEIFEIVNLAKATLTPLIPISSGAPHFRGDTVPTTGGAIIVDLSGMKKIIRIDRKNRVAMFEPGVTFSELSSAVAGEGMRLNMPLLPRASKSVTGSLLEREPVLMPKYHWDISDPLACTEVVFGTGEMFRTGAAAGSGTIEEQWAAGGAQKEAAGPSSVSWYRVIQGSQGTMGIVTWVSARCELLPRLEEPFFAGSSRIENITDTIHWLIRLRLVNECLVLNNTNLAIIMSAGDPGEYQRLKTTLPPWILFFNIAGYEYLPEERVSGQVKDMIDITRRTGVQAVKTLDSVSASDFLKMVQRASPEPYWKLSRKGGCQDIFFITIFDKLPEMVQTINASAEAANYPASDLGIYLQPTVQGVNCHCEFNLFYNPSSAAESTRVKALSMDATKNLLAKGAFFSRPYGEVTNLIMNRDAATVETLKRVKSITDPANIMNPGKLCF